MSQDYEFLFPYMMIVSRLAVGNLAQWSTIQQINSAIRSSNETHNK